MLTKQISKISSLAKTLKMNPMGVNQTNTRNFGGAVDIKRNQSFKVLEDKDISQFESLLDKSSVITDPELI